MALPRIDGVIARLRGVATAEVWIARDAVAATIGNRRAGFRPAGSAPAQLAASMADALEALGARRVRAAVTLSNALVRLAVLPPTGRLAGGEAATLARSALRAVHGDAVQGWRVTYDIPGGSRSGVAAAVDPALVDALQRALPADRCTLTTVEPLLSRAMRAGDRRAERWVVALEPGYACVARHTRAGWERLRARAVLNRDEDDGLQRLVEQCSAGCLAAGDAPQVEVVAPHRAAAAPRFPSPWRVEVRRVPALERLLHAP